MDDSTQTSIPKRISSPEVTRLRVSQIVVAENVRQKLTKVDELIESVKVMGVLEPLRVKLTSAGEYVLEAGHRRLAAAQALGLDFVPVVVSELPDSLRRLAQLAENHHREDLNAFETADALHAEISNGRTVDEIAELMGKGGDESVRKKWVHRHLALLKLEPKLVASMRRAGVGIRNAETIASAARKGRLEDALDLVRRSQDKTTFRKTTQSQAVETTAAPATLRFSKRMATASYRMEIRSDTALDEARITQIEMLVHSVELALSGLS